MDSSFTQPLNKHTPTPGGPISALPIAITSQYVDLAKIHDSPFNPRKEFDKEGIAELAASIAQRGLQQNLVVRPHPKKPGQFELMAGHRRLKALQLNKAAGCLCNVIEADDGEARANLIVENLQRQDLGPLEEAEAFDQLAKSDPKTWTTEAIALAIGKTQRFVQQRLALIRNLSPETAKLMKSGQLNVESARVLAAAPHALQEKALKGHLWNISGLTADRARVALAEHAVPKSAASFDVALYKGEWIEDGKTSLFADVAAFDKLQKEAARARVDKLKTEGWTAAQLVGSGALNNWVWIDNGKSLHWNRSEGGTAAGKIDKVKATAIVWIDQQHKIRVAEGVKPKPKEKPGSSTVYSSPPSYKEAPERKVVRLDFNTRVGTAYAKDAAAPLRLLLLEIVTGDSGINISRDILKRALPAIPMKSGWLNDDEKAKLWPKFAALKDAAILRALLELGRGMVDFDDEYSDVAWSDRQKSCPALLAALGTTLGVKPLAEETAAPAPKKTVGAHENKAKPKVVTKKVAKKAAKAALKGAARAKKHQ